MSGIRGNGSRLMTGPALAIVLLLVLPGPTSTQEFEEDGARLPVPGAHRYPGGSWMRYVDVADAGFSAADLEDARRFWEKRSDAAFLAVSGGAVVVSWGDVERRFMTHSIRKSLLSALYGVHQDAIDLDATLAELGIDDVSPLTSEEKAARVVDLLRSRSGVYHPAAAEPAEMSGDRPARGSHAPGTRWWYNNWDFNVAGTVFRQETGRDLFEAFAETIASPLGMQDFRVTDGFYHVEPDKSVHPGYPVRMSTRDLARFGLLFARGGKWNSEQVIPAAWVTESTRSQSEIDVREEYGTGYGYMWWVDDSRGFSARGYGGHVLAVYPALDLVLVVRADTYHDRFLPDRAIGRLFDMVLDAGGGMKAETPRLAPLPASSGGSVAGVEMPQEQRSRWAGDVVLESGRVVSIVSVDEGLAVDYGMGFYRIVPEGETRFRMEDSQDPGVFDVDGDGRVVGVLTEQLAYLEAGTAADQGDTASAVAWVRRAAEAFPRSPTVHYNLARALHGTGRSAEAMKHLRIAAELRPGYRVAESYLRRLYLSRYGPLGAAGILMLVMGWLLVRRAGGRINR